VISLDANDPKLGMKGQDEKVPWGPVFGQAKDFGATQEIAQRAASAENLCSLSSSATRTEGILFYNYS
jgi:hypothetical protein